MSNMERLERIAGECATPAEFIQLIAHAMRNHARRNPQGSAAWFGAADILLAQTKGTKQP